MRAACIDIGSNTTRLLVADCHEHGLSDFPPGAGVHRIGHGLGPSGEISQAKIREVVAVVVAQIAVARDHGALELRGGPPPPSVPPPTAAT